MSWLDRFKKAGAPEADAPVVTAADQRGALDPRVHHEYFVADEPIDGRWPWLCRVYAADGQPSEMTGSEETESEARTAAIAWADATKNAMRSKE